MVGFHQLRIHGCRLTIRYEDGSLCSHPRGKGTFHALSRRLQPYTSHRIIVIPQDTNPFSVGVTSHEARHSGRELFEFRAVSMESRCESPVTERIVDEKKPDLIVLMLRYSSLRGHKHEDLRQLCTSISHGAHRWTSTARSSIGGHTPEWWCRSRNLSARLLKLAHEAQGLAVCKRANLFLLWEPTTASRDFWYNNRTLVALIAVAVAVTLSRLVSKMKYPHCLRPFALLFNTTLIHPCPDF